MKPSFATRNEWMTLLWQAVLWGAAVSVSLNALAILMVWISERPPSLWTMLIERDSFLLALGGTALFAAMFLLFFLGVRVTESRAWLRHWLFGTACAYVFLLVVLTLAGYVTERDISLRGLILLGSIPVGGIWLLLKHIRQAR
jgi:hypothetical protein